MFVRRILHNNKGAGCNKFVDISQPATFCQKADIRMRLHGLRQLVDNRSVVSC